MSATQVNAAGRLELVPNAKIDATVVVAGDYYIWETESASMDFDGKDAALVAPVKAWIAAADHSLLNLEGPLSRRGAPIPKSGPNLRMPPERIDFVRAAGFNAVTLANNHIGDYGPEATLDTLAELDKAHIPHVGAGKDLADARKPLFLEANGKTIAVLNYAENEFGGATDDQAGASTLNLPANLRQIRAVAAQADITLVIIHGGTEHYPFPAPDRADSYRALAEAGATAIVSHHPHTPQGIERHGDVPIVYSTGNFFFPAFDESQRTPRSFWSVGYAVKLFFSGGKVSALEILPYRFDQGRLQLFDNEGKKEFADYLNRLSAPLSDAKELEEFFAAHAANQKDGLFRLHNLDIAAEPEGDLLRNTLIRRNLFTCEAHAELQRTFLRLVETKRLGVKGKDKIPVLAELTDATRRFSNPATPSSR